MLISAAELYDIYSDESTVVFDCRFKLGAPGDGRERYLQGHIPGACYLDLEQDLSGPVSRHGGRHPLPNLTELAAKFTAAGVRNGSTVVVYDDGEGMAPRAWWLLRYLGHDRCFLLDGGLKAWQASGYELDNDVPLPRAGSFQVNLRSDWVVGVEAVEGISAGQRPGQLVDARAPERYRGDVEPIDAAAGHIPGAVNVPWTDGVNPDGTWKSSAAQRDRFRDLTPGTTWVMYCGSGVTACANVFALHLAGVTDVKLYPGSWSDWISYPEHRIERNPS